MLGTIPCPAPRPAAKSESEYLCAAGILSVGKLGDTGGAGLGPAATKPCHSEL